MSRPMLFWTSILLLAALLVPLPRAAQSGEVAQISQPDTQNFPQVTTHLSVYGPQGEFIRQLLPADIAILEDGQPVPATHVELREPGVQFVVALNPGPSFAIRDSNGISRYDLLRAVLINWIDAYSALHHDDLTLLTSSGPRQKHLSDPLDWARAFKTYQPDSRNLTPSFDLLAEALATAADPAPQPGMGRAVLFITPPPDRDSAAAITTLLSQAQQQNIRLYIWMIGSPATFDTLGAQQLTDFSLQTGGRTFRFTGEEELPQIENYIDPLRYVYDLQYESRLRSSGSFTVTAEVNVSGQKITSNPHTVTVEVLPPNPVFLNPPLTVERSVAEQSNRENEVLLPTQRTLQILIEFPDGHTRSLGRTSLWVNGEMVDENLQAPFDSFNWNISSYTENGQLMIKTVVEDRLGLTGESIEIPVRIQILGRAGGIVGLLQKRMPLIAALAGIAAGVLLLWVLIVGGRLRPTNPLVRSRRQRRALENDPVTQPVTARIEPRKPKVAVSRLSALASRFSRQPRRSSQPPSAFIERLGSNGSGSAPESLTDDGVVFGSNAFEATYLLEDPSVAGIHARLVRRENGDFRLYDENSVAGTWVNYSPVPRQGKLLEHGDLFFIGRVRFRFHLADESRARRLLIEPDGNDT